MTLHIRDRDNGSAVDLGYATPRVTGPYGFWPWVMPTAASRALHDDCKSDGCWYAREGFRKCRESTDGVCILANQWVTKAHG